MLLSKGSELEHLYEQTYHSLAQAPCTRRLQVPMSRVNRSRDRLMSEKLPPGRIPFITFERA